MADIFNILNTLNSSLQGTSVTVFSVQDKTEATIKKLNLWCNRIEKEKYDSFHMLSDFIDFSEPLSSDVAESMIEHMRSLVSQL
jgi:2-keto-4-pentenoate hydratase